MRGAGKTILQIAAFVYLNFSPIIIIIVNGKFGL